MLSVALALTLTVPDTVVPAAGAVIATVGAVVSVIVTLTGAEVAVAPRLLVATAVNEYAPGTAALHASEYGEVVSSPIFVAPAKNWTFVTLPLVLAAVAASPMFAG